MGGTAVGDYETATVVTESMVECSLALYLTYDLHGYHCGGGGQNGVFGHSFEYFVGQHSPIC